MRCFLASEQSINRKFIVYEQEIEKAEKRRKEEGWFKNLLENAVKIKDVFPATAESREVHPDALEPAHRRKAKDKLQYSTFQFSNPADLSKDPTHWLTANMIGLTPEKRRDYRIERLRHVMKSYELSDRQKMVKQHLESLQRMKIELVEDAVEHIVNPFIREVYNPTVAFVTPYMEYVAKESAHYAAVIAADPRVVEAVRVIKLYLEFIKQHTMDRITEAILHQHNQFIAEVVRQLKITAKAIADVKSLNLSAAEFADIQAVMEFICQAIESNVATENQVRKVLQSICEIVVSKFDEAEFSVGKSIEEGPERRDEIQEDFLQAIQDLKSSQIDPNQRDKSRNSDVKEDTIDINEENEVPLENAGKEMEIDKRETDYQEEDEESKSHEEEREDDEVVEEEEEEDEDSDDEKAEGGDKGNDDDDDDESGDDETGSSREETQVGKASSFSLVADKLRSAVAELEILSSEEREVVADLTADDEDPYEDVMELVVEMIHAVELNAHDINCLNIPKWNMSEQEVDDTQPKRELLEGDLSQRVFGFEVSIDVVITKAIREALDIDTLTAEDIAVLLEQQLFSFGSSLHSGQISKNCVAISHTLPYKRRAFEEWEQFWINSLHPAFFGYSAVDTKPKKSTVSIAKSMSAEQVLALKAKQFGLQFTNPTDNFSTRNKETFESLNQELPEGEDEDRDGKAAVLRKKQRRMKLGEEEFDTHHKALKMYRPNLATVTEKDIERLARLHRAFKKNYELEMQSGLIDGTGMKPEQYAALKNRDTAFRYQTTKPIAPFFKSFFLSQVISSSEVAISSRASRHY